jgi:hypothetical protein
METVNKPRIYDGATAIVTGGASGIMLTDVVPARFIKII